MTANVTEREQIGHTPAPPATEPPPAAQDGISRPVPSRRGRWMRRVAAVAFSFLLFNVCLALYTRHNDFPHRYHPDEQSKAFQIQEYRDLNFNHPLLLLEVSNWAVRRFEVDLTDQQAIIETGRWVSALFGAGTAVALAWVGYASGGLLGMVIVGAAVGLCPKLLLYSHYMKEDVGLVFGLALTLLGSRAAWDARRWWTRLPALVLLGVGAGVAASGKYVGAVSLAMAIPAALLLPRMRWHWRAVAPVFVVWCAVVTLLAINWRIMDEAHFYRFIDGFEREAEHGMTQHSGLTLGRNNTFFVGLIPVETMPHARVLAGVLVVCALGALVRRFRRTWDVLAIAFVCVFLYALAQSAIPFHRYFLPVAVMIYLLAGLGAVALLNLFGRRGWLRWVAGAAVLVVIVGLQGVRCADYLHQFADDGRVRLRQWIAQNVPAGSRIMAEDYTGLTNRGDGGDPRPGRDVRLPPGVMIYNVGAGPDSGDLARIARRGIDYIAVSDTRYNRYFAPVTRIDGDDAELERFRQWYRQLDADPGRFELVWSNQPANPTHSFTNPTLKLYRVKREPQ